MNKITLILQEKSAITELAKDESVKIRIADAIIDGIRKRSSKIGEGVARRITEEFEAHFYKKDTWKKSLSDDVKLKIAKEISSIVSDIVQEESSDIRKEVSIRLNDLRSSIQETLEKINIEPYVERYVRQIVKEKFNL